MLLFAVEMICVMPRQASVTFFRSSRSAATTSAPALAQHGKLLL
jgi:hypothetical protein